MFHLNGSLSKLVQYLHSCTKCEVKAHFQTTIQQSTLYNVLSGLTIPPNLHVHKTTTTLDDVGCSGMSQHTLWCLAYLLKGCCVTAICTNFTHLTKILFTGVHVINPVHNNFPPCLPSNRKDDTKCACMVKNMMTGIFLQAGAVVVSSTGCCASKTQ